MSLFDIHTLPENKENWVWTCASCTQVKTYKCPCDHLYTFDWKNVEEGEAPGCEECYTCDMAAIECEMRASGRW